MNFHRSGLRRLGLPALLIAFFSTMPAVRAEPLPDPLGIRASCVRTPNAAPRELDIWSLGENFEAEATAFLRRSIGATVVLTVASCDLDVCGGWSPTGTGVVVSGDGLVLTAFHVIKDAAVIKATFRSVDADGYVTLTTRVVAAQVVAVAPDKDVALLQLKKGTADYPHMPLDCRWQAPKRSPIWHFGQKSGWEYGRVTLQSTVSVEIAGVYETDARARPGDSGAPFTKTSGELIGILLSRHGDSRSYYMPVADAIAALEKAAAAR